MLITRKPLDNKCKKNRSGTGDVTGGTNRQSWEGAERAEGLEDKTDR